MFKQLAGHSQAGFCNLITFLLLNKMMPISHVCSRKNKPGFLSSCTMTSTFGPSCLLPYPKWLTKGVFNSPFTPKNSRFWSIILHNGTKHHAKFLAKSGYSLFWILASRAKKKEPQEAIMRAINFAFRINLIFLAFSISSFQSC